VKAKPAEILKVIPEVQVRAQVAVTDLVCRYKALETITFTVLNLNQASFSGQAQALRLARAFVRVRRDFAEAR
jgi:hypothetical protein